MNMFAKKLSVSFIAIVVVFTSNIAYNHAEESPKVSFFNTPSSSDISELSPAEVDKLVLKPVSIGLNGWGRIPRVPKFLNGWGRIPRAPKFGHRGSLRLRIPPTNPPHVLPKVLPPPVRTQPTPQTVQSSSVWSSLLAADPPFKSPSLTPTAKQLPVKAPTSVTEPQSLNPARTPSPASGWADSPTAEPPTVMFPGGGSQKFKRLIV